MANITVSGRRIPERSLMAKKPKTETPAEDVQQKFQQMREDMNDALIEREGEVDVVLTALICGEHPLLVGPPGTAKSLLLDSLMEWFGSASKWSGLFNKFTTPEEVFGPVSLTSLKEDIFKRITTGKLPEAVFGYGDEIFKASTAILNTLLRILNERLFENGDGTYRKVPLLMFVAASNEWPNDQNGGAELGALFDRFLFRKTVKKISSRAGRSRLLWDRNHTPSLSSSMSAEEIKVAKGAAQALTLTDDVKETFTSILEELAREGIQPGDRRQYKSVDAVRAYAWLMGEKEEVKKEHMEILAHTLWDDPTEQPEKCAKIVLKAANPLRSQLIDFLLQVDDIVTKNVPTEAVPKLQAIQEQVKRLPENKLSKQARDHISSVIKECYDKVIGA